MTNTIKSEVKTGIQRVVTELSKRFSQKIEYQLLFYEGSNSYVLNNNQLQRWILGNKNISRTEFRFSYCQIDPGDIFLDLDASWGDCYDAGECYSLFKRRGALIVKFHHDAVPILYPEMSHIDTVYRFTENFSQAVVYSDYWICTSKVVETDLKAIFRSLSLASPQSFIVNLGSDLGIEDRRGEKIRPDCNRILQKKYMLAVGTIEPRKNYSLILDVFDEFLALGIDQTVSLILVGKPGWNNVDIINRIEGHSELNKRVFWYKDANDTELDALYRSAQVCLCLSHYEGYGLPVIEGLSRGSQVICTADTALEEVSKGYAFPVSLQVSEVLATVNDILFEGKKKDVSKFIVPSWDASANDLDNVLIEITSDLSNNPLPYQAVYISVRPGSIRQSILSVLRNMNFITEVIILTSDEYLERMHCALEGVNIKLVILSESEIGIKKLPEDHLQRNTFLRKVLYSRIEIAANFIAFDDDYLVSDVVTPEDFYVNGKHIGYYFLDGSDEWLGAHAEPTSFDNGIWRTRDFLLQSGFDVKLYNSHQPQIINKDIARYTLDVAVNCNLDEWSSYFNIAKHLKPQMFADNVYRTAGWPANFDSWLPSEAPQEILFFNDPPISGRDDYGVEVDLYIEQLRSTLGVQGIIRKDQLKLFIKSDSVSFSQSNLVCRSSSIILYLYIVRAR